MDIDLLAVDPELFVASLVVPTSAGPRVFGSCMADFQREAFAALAPSLQAVVAGEPPPIPRFWIERTKGGSKDSDLACALLWLLAFSPRPLRIQIAANDQEQADEIRLIIKAILRLDGPVNELLAEITEATGDKILNRTTDSAAQILTRDSKGGHGARPDVLIVNELTHIQDEEYAQTCVDNLDKIPSGLGIFALNSGFDPSWQARWKSIATSSPRWFVQEYRQPSPWVSTDDLAESERRNPRSRFRRLWWGEWASGDGDALDADQIRAAIVLPGPQTEPQRGYAYFCGIDLGLRKDHSAIVVVGMNVGYYEERPPIAKPYVSTTRAALRDLYPHDYPTEEISEEFVWTPGDGRVDLIACAAFNNASRAQRSHDNTLTDLWRTVSNLHRTWNFQAVFVDQWQAQLLCERLRAEGVPAVGIDPVGATLRAQAALLMDHFRERTIRLYDDPVLLADLGKLRLVEKSYGVRLEAPRGTETGGSYHADTASAFTLALLAAHRSAGTTPVVANQGAPLLCWP